MDVLSDKKSDEGIQKWIDSISTSQDGQDPTNRDANDSSPVQNKKSCATDDLSLGDEATTSKAAAAAAATAATESSCKNIFQQMMRKKFSDKVTGASFNSDATSDTSLQMVLDSRRRSAELILRNLGFRDTSTCSRSVRVVPERFFKEPSAANGISGSCPPVGVASADGLRPDDSRDRMIAAVDSLVRLITAEKRFSNHRHSKKKPDDHNNSSCNNNNNNNNDKNHHNDDEVVVGNDDDDEVDGPLIPDDNDVEEEEEEEATQVDGGTVVGVIMELFQSKVNQQNGFAGNSTSASGSPPGMLQGGGNASLLRVVRPSLRITRAGTRYWTILQPDNADYLNSVGYYDTMPTVSEPCHSNPYCLELEEQFNNTLAKLQQLERPHKKKKGAPKTDTPGTTRLTDNGSNHPADNGATPNDLREAKKEEEEDVEEEDKEGKGHQKKIMGLPSRSTHRVDATCDGHVRDWPCLPPSTTEHNAMFLHSSSLLCNLTGFVPGDSSANAGPDGAEVGQRVGVGGDVPPLYRGSLRGRHHHQPLHRQSSVFSDMARDEDDNDEDDFDRGATDVTFRFSDSSYSCGGSSCSSLPRDLELERYYASKNMLRLPTGESDDVASCISDRTTVNENTARMPSTGEGPEGTVQQAEKNLPDLADFRRRLRARMTRQTSSQSDSSGFGDSEFVDALTHQQLHSGGKSAFGSLPRSNELGRAPNVDLGTSNSELRSAGRPDGEPCPPFLCPSCTKNRNSLKVDTWCQTPLTSFRQEEWVVGRPEVDRPECFKSEFSIDNGGDSALCSAPLGSEVCLFLGDEQRRPRTSTTLNIQVSKLRPPDRRHSVDQAQRRISELDRPTTYELLSSDDSSFLRRQSLPPTTHQEGFVQLNHQGGTFHHLYQRRFNHHHHHHRPPSSSSLSLWRSNRAPLSDLELWQDSEGTQLVEQAYQLPNVLPSHREEVKEAESGSPEGNAHKQSGGSEENPSLLLCDEALKRVDRMDDLFLEWGRKATSGDTNATGLGKMRSHLRAMENVLRLVRDCHNDGSHHRLHHHPHQCHHHVPPVPLIITEASPMSSSPQFPEKMNRPERLQIPNPLFLNLPNEPSSSSSSPNMASSTLTGGSSTEFDLEVVKERLKVIEERIASQQEHQESALKNAFKEFKDSLVEEVKKTINSQS